MKLFAQMVVKLSPMFPAKMSNLTVVVLDAEMDSPM
jgi:hypothetical protein